MKNTTTTALSVAILAVAIPSHGATFVVPGDFPTIQGALNAALDGDTILVQPGTYHEDVFFNGHDVTLIGVAGSSLTEIEPDGSTAIRVLLGETVTIEGFALIAGVKGFEIDGGSDVTVIDCLTIAGNTGATVFGSSTATFRNCQMVGFISRGIEAQPTSTVVLEDCFIQGSPGGSNQLIELSHTTLTATRCEFDGFGAANAGIFAVQNSPITLIDCLVTGISGTAAIQTGNPTAVTLIGCTVAGNTTGAILGSNQAMTVTNTIIWGNTVSTQSVSLASNFSYSCIEGGFPGMDFSISTDPMLNAAFRLLPGSPCIDLGNNAGGNSDFDLGGAPRFLDDPDTPDCPQPGANCGLAPVVDMGAYEFRLCAASDFDDDGLVGINDFLFLLAAWGTPDADGTGDGDTGIDDFLLLLASWGPCQ